jgi:hypothetical protein
VSLTNHEIWVAIVKRLRTTAVLFEFTFSWKAFKYAGGAIFS